MSKTFLNMVLCGVCLLPVAGGCTHKAPPAPEPKEVENVFSRNARLISEEMVLLMGASAPEAVQAPALAPMPRYPALASPVQIVWHGGLTEGVRTVASKIGFKAEVYGAEPATPIVVDSMNRTTAQDILQQFGVQSGERANIIADIPARTLRVVYASFVGKPEPKAKQPRSTVRKNTKKTESKKQPAKTNKTKGKASNAIPAEKTPVTAPAVTPVAPSTPVSAQKTEQPTPARSLPSAVQPDRTPPAVSSSLPEQAPPVQTAPVQTAPSRTSNQSSIKMDVIEEDVTITLGEPATQKKTDTLPPAVSSDPVSPSATIPAPSRRPRQTRDTEMVDLLQSLDEEKK